MVQFLENRPVTIFTPDRIAPGESETLQRILATIKKIRRLLVGGQEGSKFRVSVELASPSERLDTIGQQITLVAKRYSRFSEDRVQSICAEHAALKNLGFPVPELVGYVKGLLFCYVVMSDQTENGQKKVWGLNDMPSSEELVSLSEMQIQLEDLKEIEKLVVALASKGMDEEVTIMAHEYHIRRDTETGELDVILLDREVPEEYEVASPLANQAFAQEFLYLLKEKLKLIT